jgi:hypothetical protein
MIANASVYILGVLTLPSLLILWASAELRKQTFIACKRLIALFRRSNQVDNVSADANHANNQPLNNNNNFANGNNNIYRVRGPLCSGSGLPSFPAVN